MVQRGQLEEGATSIQRGIEILDSIEFRTGLSGYLGLLADARRRQRDFAAAEDACARAGSMVTASNFVWFEPELLRIEGLIVNETRGIRQAEEALRRAIARAQALAFPVLERRCLISLKQLLGPTHHDLEAETRLKELSYFSDLSQKVSRIMSRPADLLKA